MAQLLMTDFSVSLGECGTIAVTAEIVVIILDNHIYFVYCPQ